MATRLIAALSIALFPSLVFAGDDFKTATPQELSMKEVAMAPGAPAVILDWAQRSDDQNFRKSEYVRIKVLTDEGKKYGDVSVTHVPLLTNVDYIKARLTKPDGTVVPFNGKIYDKVLLKAGGVRVISKTFTLPDVQPGSIIEYSYELGYRQNLLFDSYFTVQRELPILHELLWLRPWTRGNYAAFFLYKGLPPGKTPVKDGDHFSLDLENVPAFEKEPLAPPEEQLKPAVIFYYAEHKTDPETFWNKVNKDATESVERFIGDRSGIRTAAQQAVAGATSDEDKLKKLYARVQQVRNLSFEPEKTEQETRELRDNKSVEDVLRNGFGWRDEITRLFVAMARGAGFEANVYRIADRSERFLSKKLPLESQLNNEIAGVQIGGNVRYLDPATPFAPFGMLSWEKTKVSGLRIAKKTNAATWVDTPEDGPESARLSRVAKLRIDGDTLKGNVMVTFSGHEAMSRRHEQLNHDDETAKKAIEDEIKAWFFNGTAAKLTKLTGLRGSEGPLVAELEVELPTTGVVTGSRALVPMAVFTAAQKTALPSERRKNDLYFHYEYRVDDDVTLDVPAGYNVEALPQSSRIDMGALTYLTKYEQTPSSVRLARSMEIACVFVPADKYSVARNFFSQVATADQNQLVLKKAAK